MYYYFARGSGCEVLWYVCLSASISSEPHARSLPNVLVLVANVRGSVLLRHVDDRPHRLSGRGFLSHWKCIYRPGKGDWSAQRRRSMLSTIALLSVLLLFKTSQFKTVCKGESGYITQVEQQKSKTWYYLAAHRRIVSVLTSICHLFDFCSFSCVM